MRWLQPPCLWKEGSGESVGGRKCASWVVSLLTATVLLSLASRSVRAYEDAYLSVRVLVAKGVLRGYPDGSLGLDRPITRAEAITCLWRAVTKGSGTANMSHPFVDMDRGHWASGAVGWAWSLGIVEGVGEGEFDPDSALMPEHARLLLGRLGISMTGTLVPVPEADHFGAQERFLSRQEFAGILCDALDSMGLLWDLTGVVDEVKNESGFNTLVLRVADGFTVRLEHCNIMVLGEETQLRAGDRVGLILGGSGTGRGVSACRVR